MHFRKALEVMEDLTAHSIRHKSTVFPLDAEMGKGLEAEGGVDLPDVYNWKSGTIGIIFQVKNPDGTIVEFQYEAPTLQD